MPSGPKNVKYTNRHALEARERDAERSMNDKERKAQAAEDASWAETDAKALKKQAKAAEDADKAAEAERRRQEKKELEAEEERTIDAGKPKKISKKDLQREMAKLCANYDTERQKIRSGAVVEASSDPLPKGNVNAAREASQGPGAVQASGLDNVLQALGTNENRGGSGGGSNVALGGGFEDRNIGKKARVLFRQFQKDNMQRVKNEHPNMRLTQYNDLLWDLWQKSPLNPFVLRAEGRAAEAVSRERSWMFEADSDGEAEA